jgi:hypothetical protein
MHEINTRKIHPQRHSSQAAVRIFLGLCCLGWRASPGVLRCDSLEQVKSLQKAVLQLKGLIRVKILAKPLMP